MVFKLDLNKYQPLLTPLAVFLGCVVIAAAIYGSGGITIGRKVEEESENPAVAGEEEAVVTPSYDAAVLERFAKCLTEKGAKLYTADWCPHCANQKALFGDAVGYLDNIVCSKESTDPWSEECKSAGINVVPTWVLGDSSRLEGGQALEDLAQKTGCALE